MYLDGKQFYFTGAVLDISRNGSVPVFRCCGLRNNASDIRPADALAAGFEPPSHTLVL